MAEFQLDVFGARSGEIGVEVDAICDFRHQGFREAQHDVLVVVILDHRGEREAARVGCVIECAVVIDCPV